ncbi:hypothetical protein ACJMK2_019924 [Sinanodonta woodiana]|uniref:Sulfotransferase domain-containing protein n=1 Tax=Sinanodonta woodiana TaxID=1069815 RepID=A0ABD3U023_SINWO
MDGKNKDEIQHPSNDGPPSFPKEFNGLSVQIVFDGAGRPIPVVEVDGVKWPLPFIQHLVPGGNILEHLDMIKNMAIQDDDIMLCTYPKSGTHWIWEIVSMLLKGKAEYEKKVKETAMLEFGSKDELKSIRSPRIFNTHLPVRMLPREITEKKKKIIHVQRNPKDVVVSLYNHIKAAMLGGDRSSSATMGTFSDMFPLLVSGGINNQWHVYVEELEKFTIDNPDYPILTLNYEDMKEDPKREIIKVANFLGIHYTPELIDDVQDKCDFENLKKANEDIKDDITKKLSKDGKQFMYRKGQVGDWKNWFTVAQNEEFDQLYIEWMSGSNLKFRFTL